MTPEVLSSCRSGADANFDLLTLGDSGPGRGVTPTGRTLCWNYGNSAGSIEFDEITPIAPEALPGDAVSARCDIGLPAGYRLQVYIINASPAQIAEYREFVREPRAATR